MKWVARLKGWQGSNRLINEMFGGGGTTKVLTVVRSMLSLAGKKKSNVADVK